MWHTLDKEEILYKFGTSEKLGLSEITAKKIQEKNGKNKLRDKPKEKLIVKFIKQFKDFMIIILIIASIVSAGMAWYEGSNDYIDSIIIIAIVILNAIMGVLQEAKAEKSIESLKKMTPQKTKVIRDGQEKEINVEDVVPGDIVILESGNYIPADCRLLESFNLKVEESSLTGETVPVLKDAGKICKEKYILGGMVSMVFMTSIVVNGHAKAIVTETGMDTKVGKIANMIIENEALNLNTKEIKSSWKNIRCSMFNNLSNNLCNRINKKYRSN